MTSPIALETLHTWRNLAPSLSTAIGLSRRSQVAPRRHLANFRGETTPRPRGMPFASPTPVPGLPPATSDEATPC